MRLDHLLSKEHFYTLRHTGDCGCVRDRFDPNVVRRTLMGGTLTCAEPGSDVVDTLLGPERTDVLSRQNDEAGFQSYRATLVVAGAG